MDEAPAEGPDFPPPGYGPPPPPGYGVPPGHGPPPPPGYGVPPGYGPPPPPGHGPPPPPGYGVPPGYGPPPPPGYGVPPGYGNWGPPEAVIPPWAWAQLPKGGSERTGPLPLHPMSISDILDGAIKVWRANARTLLLIVAGFMVPLELLLAFLQRNVNGGNGILSALSDPAGPTTQTNSGTTLVLAAVTSVAFWFVVPLVCGGASRVVLVSYLGGELGPKEAFAAALRRAPAVLVASLLVHGLELLAALACVIPVIFLMPLFMMTAPAISIEGLGPIAGMRRSVRLARRRYWPTVGAALLAGLLAALLNQVLGLVPSTIALLIGLRWGWILLAASGVLVALVTVPLITIVATMVYLDARIRQEGLDLQVTAAGLDQR